MKETKWSPVQIHYILHCYAIAEPPPRDASPVHTETHRMFEEMEMIKPSARGGSVWTTTDKGDAFVEALLSTPEPVCVWTTEREKE